MRAALKPVIALVVVQLAIFVASLPGFGLETRTPSQYAPWAGPIFLVLTVLVFVLGLASVGVGSSRWIRSAQLASAQGIAALAIDLFDFSRVGGAAPPLGPLVLGLISVLVALLQIVLAGRALRLGSTPLPAP